MPHKAKLLTDATNENAADPGFLYQRRTAILNAKTLKDLGEALEFTAKNVAVLEGLEPRLAPVLVQGIIGAFRGAVMTEPGESIQVVWVQHGGESVDIGASVTNGVNTSPVSIVVRTPAFDEL